MTKGTKRVHRENIQVIEVVAPSDAKGESLIDAASALGQVPPTHSSAQSDPIVLSNLDVIDLTYDDPVLSLSLQC